MTGSQFATFRRCIAMSLPEPLNIVGFHYRQYQREEGHAATTKQAGPSGSSKRLKRPRSLHELAPGPDTSSRRAAGPHIPPPGALALDDHHFAVHGCPAAP